jgi:hypothetical protein
MVYSLQCVVRRRSQDGSIANVIDRLRQLVCTTFCARWGEQSFPDFPLGDYRDRIVLEFPLSPCQYRLARWNHFVFVTRDAPFDKRY